MCKKKKIVQFLIGTITLLLFFDMQVCMPGNVRASTVSSGDGLQSVSGGDSLQSVSGGDGLQSVSEGIAVNQEIIKVVLPTQFTVLMYEDLVENNIHLCTQDIVLVNKSDFPVNISVKDVKYELTTEADLYSLVQIREFQKEEYSIAYPYNKEVFEPFSIILDETQQYTNSDMLMEEAEGWNSIGEVQSPDYGILRLEGIADNTNLKENDVEVKIVFEFEKYNERYAIN